MDEKASRAESAVLIMAHTAAGGEGKEQQQLAMQSQATTQGTSLLQGVSTPLGHLVLGIRQNVTSPFFFPQHQSSCIPPYLISPFQHFPYLRVKTLQVAVAIKAAKKRRSL
jgi:hypothetical protein